MTAAATTSADELDKPPPAADPATSTTVGLLTCAHLGAKLQGELETHGRWGASTCASCSTWRFRCQKHAIPQVAHHLREKDASCNIPSNLPELLCLLTTHPRDPMKALEMGRAAAPLVLCILLPGMLTWWDGAMYQQLHANSWRR